MHKTMTFKSKIFFNRVTAGVCAVVFCLAQTSAVYADYYDDQINAIKNQVTQFQDQAAQLHTQADTLQNQLNTISNQQSEVQAQILGTQIKLQQLTQQIQNTQVQIDNQMKALALTLRDIYLDSNVSPLEMVASSNSISDFIDKQQYRNALRNHIQDSLKQVKQLKVTLDAEKASTEQTLADQTGMQRQLVSQQKNKDDLLAQTQGQESNYQQLVGQKNQEIDKLRKAQAAANLKWSGGRVNFQARGGGYPSFWADIPLDSTADDWGMYNRECVSYAAFRVASSGRHMPYWGGVGDAIEWPGNARAAGIPVSGAPKASDVAIWPVGHYGHAMYVEAVYDDGSILISEYNYDWSGRYSQRVISAATIQAQGFEFVHFQ